MDKSKIKEYNSNHYKKNKERIKENTKNYKEKNIDKIRERNREYYYKNKDNIKNKRKSIKTKINSKIREYNKKYYKERYNNDIQFNLRVRMCNNFRISLYKYNETERLDISKNKNINYKKIIKHLEPLPKNIKDYHIDHIIPLCFFDLTKEEDVEKVWKPINIQLITIKENLEKGNNIDFDKYPIQKIVCGELSIDDKDIINYNTRDRKV